MITLCVFPNFKGKRKDAALVLLTCLMFDSFIILCCTF